MPEQFFSEYDTEKPTQPDEPPPKPKPADEVPPDNPIPPWKERSE